MSDPNVSNVGPKYVGDAAPKCVSDAVPYRKWDEYVGTA